MYRRSKRQRPPRSEMLCRAPDGSYVELLASGRYVVYIKGKYVRTTSKLLAATKLFTEMSDGHPA